MRDFKELLTEKLIALNACIRREDFKLRIQASSLRRWKKKSKLSPEKGERNNKVKKPIDKYWTKLTKPKVGSLKRLIKLKNTQ